MKSDPRKIQPDIVQVGPGNLTGPRLYFLDNKVPVYMIEAGSEELMKLEFIFDAGQIRETVPLLSTTVNMMLPEGSRNYTAEALNHALDYYGTFFNTYAEKDTAGMSILFLTRHLEKIIELCSDIILHPMFPGPELDALMKKRLQWYNVGREKVHVVASDQFFESVFGTGHPYGKQVTEGDFEGITPDLLREFHTSYYPVNEMTIIVAGKIPGETFSILNRYFGQDKSAGCKPGNHLPVPHGEKLKKVLIPREDAVQSAIRIGLPTINKHHPDYKGFKVVDTILGGYFSSRLMKNIREEKGFTYGISSSLVSFRLSGYMVIATEVGTEYTGQTIDEIYGEVEKLQKYPVESNELEIVRNFMLGEMVRMFDGPFSIAESFRALWEFGLDNSYYYSLADKIKSIEPDEIIHLARTYYNIDSMYEIVAGPK